MDPRSQYCSWLITIAKSYVVSLKFQELTIPSCDDTFLKIFEGSNDTAPLLGTYCGTNASTEIEILSSTSNLFVVANSGSYAAYPIFSFQAEYNAAENLTGLCTQKLINSRAKHKEVITVRKSLYAIKHTCIFTKLLPQNSQPIQDLY